LRGEYILPADEPFPNYQRKAKRLTAAKQTFEELQTVNAQVLQQVLRKLEAAWEAWRLKRSGLPRFKKTNRMRSFVFPQMLKNCMSADAIKLPQLGWVRVRWSRDIPEIFQVKQARLVRKASGYFVMLSLQADVEIPDTMPHGHPIGLDVGLEYFLSTSDGEQVKRPRFFNNLHHHAKSLVSYPAQPAPCPPEPPG
jgi:putative transposase